MIIIILLILIFIFLETINYHTSIPDVKHDIALYEGGSKDKHKCIMGGSDSADFVHLLESLQPIGDPVDYSGGKSILENLPTVYTSAHNHYNDSKKFEGETIKYENDLQPFNVLYAEYLDKGNKWTDYKTWEEVEKDDVALKQYLNLKKSALDFPNFNWDKVLAESLKMRKSNHEFIGHIDVEDDGTTLYISSAEKSEEEGSVKGNSNVYASISLNLLNKNIKKPAMFLFHNHPDSSACDQMPSTNDLLVAIYLAATNRFIANVMISRYGIFMYTVDTFKLHQIHSGNWELNLANYSFDIASSHECKRSYRKYRLEDRLDFYKTYGMMMSVFPSSELTATIRKNPLYSYSLDKFVDHELLNTYSEEISKLKKKYKLN